MKAPPASQDPVAQQAIRWMVLLRSGEASAEDQRAYRQWRQADARHERACSHLEQHLGVFQVPIARGISGGMLQKTLDTSLDRRQLLRRTVLGIGLLAGAGSLFDRLSPLHRPLADLRTGTGERQRFQLVDGSQLTLNARSLADLYFDAHERRVQLYEGSVLARIASDPQRRFVVSSHGQRIEALGPELIVQSDASQGCAIALNCALRISNGHDQLALRAGEKVSFDEFSFGQAQPLSGGEAAWIDGFTEARNRPLAEVVNDLRAYRPGVIQVAPEVAGLRVSGLFPLDDSDLALAALAEILPIRLAWRTSLWVSILPA
ncbi:DUF4880 domain-containing protein [Pseudomonas sp. LRF_L74]|uniref:DUF4880 domain-containing protein n=1 Tax=Pseudomonas sp. LRF_L74 TaxID=3369422 RepID=UPI003F611F20